MSSQHKYIISQLSRKFKNIIFILNEIRENCSAKLYRLCDRDSNKIFCFILSQRFIHVEHAFISCCSREHFLSVHFFDFELLHDVALLILKTGYKNRENETQNNKKIYFSTLNTPIKSINCLFTSRARFIINVFNVA